MIFTLFFAENVVFISKMGGLKNGLRIALRLFYREIWPLLCFWVGKVGFRAVKRGFERSSGKLFSGRGEFCSFSGKTVGKKSKK